MLWFYSRNMHVNQKCFIICFSLKSKKATSKYTKSIRSYLKGFPHEVWMKFIPSWGTGQWLKIHVKSFILLSFLFNTVAYSDLNEIGTPLSSLLWNLGLLPLR